MLSGQAVGVFIVCGCSINVAPTTALQYQFPWFAHTFAPALSIFLSFWAEESSRWLLLDHKHDKSLAALVRLCGLPADAEFVATEFNSMAYHIEDRNAGLGNNSSIQIIRETFLVKSNLRRVQLTIILYILSQCPRLTQSPTSYQQFSE
jgi:hypothetical protein